MENGTTIEDYSDLVMFLRMKDVKMREVPDFPSTSLQLLWCDVTGVVLVKNLLVRVHMNVVPRSTGNTNSGTEN